ncbi:hypothetical protein [Streptomonospora salina]|uniref:ATP/GTP-binding protein n=1 Tax=Streptomonospora salina TaxID=104205 RepID=A0A841ECS3_9ACTN|nr:hypothetical protein [Streptomonospora salina]MBB5998778.1 hypothetical protein [Streptomonospora salina]
METTEPRVHVARAELVLAAGDSAYLRSLPLSPDPLHQLAAAVIDVRPELGERADVCFDLVPLTPARNAHLRRKAMRAAQEEGEGLFAELGRELVGFGRELVGELVPGGGRGDTAQPAARDRGADRPTQTKFDTAEPAFEVQLLLRAESEIPGRAEAHLHQLQAAFDAWRGDNYWRAAGLNLGFAHIGADYWPWRRRFERRWTTGLFRPRKRNIVTASEVSGLLKPPTKHCESLNVRRSGGVVPRLPRELPVYNGQRDVLPIGYATGPDAVERLYGMPLDDLFFSFRIGKSRYGKTETALVQAVSLALAGHGVWFLDPHADGWKRAAPLLTDPEVLARLWEIDLTVRGDDAMIAGYNPLSMAGLTTEHIEDKVDSVVTAVASALSWPDQASRARTILTKAAETLCHLALKLPPEVAPTLFQIPTLLHDEEWRQAVIQLLPAHVRSYWSEVYTKYPAEAAPAVSNIIDRLRSSRTMSAFLGSSATTYDVRTAMDLGKVVFLCTPGGDIGRLASCFLTYDLFRAGRSRIDVAPEGRTRFDAFVDEVTAVDSASKGHLAAILEQLGKYGVRLHAMTQMAQRLSTSTRDALLQNQSLLSSTAGEVDAVRVVTRQWQRHVHPDTVVDLPRYHHIVSATVAGETTTPFRVRGATVDLFAGQHQPDRLHLQRKAIDANLGRQRIGDALTQLESLDARILAAVTSERRSAGPAPGLGSEPDEPVADGGRGSGRITEMHEGADADRSSTG